LTAEPTEDWHRLLEEVLNAQSRPQDSETRHDKDGSPNSIPAQRTPSEDRMSIDNTPGGALDCQGSSEDEEMLEEEEPV
jgi:hypothetical protein